MICMFNLDFFKMPQHSDPESAWIVIEFLKGRTQKSIGDEIGRTGSTVCVIIKQFCDEWSGVDVSASLIYGDERRKCAVIALRNYYMATEGEIKQPALWREVFPIYAAHQEYAWLLRAEGLTLQAIGDRLGLTRERVRQILAKYGRRMGWATRKTKWKWGV
jgi:hypothetical protein